MTQDSNDKSQTTDPLDQVAIATKVWRKAAASWLELADRDRAIVTAFDAGRTGTEIAAARGLDLAEVFRVHQRADQFKSDDEFDRRTAGMSRR